ncbi:MAG: SPFH domain-containing protein [Ignavibacteriales bacterium]|nr:SPFH domain-containing protein [Ignavibacteriales bacterium]
MEFFVVVAILVIAVFAFEYRFRKPDYLVLYERRGGLALRKGLLYPRHFSLPIRRTTHSLQMSVDASSKGNLEVKVKLGVTVAASLDNLSALIRVGGWSADAVARAAKDLESVLQGHVKSYTEQHGIESLSSEKIHEYLNQKLPASKTSLGLEVISLTILSFEPVNPQISEALRQQEHARILEQTETLNQKARIAASKAKLKADEEIALLENELELRKHELKKNQLERDSLLADIRINEELKRSRKKLEYDKEELDMLRSSPELLMLTPQAARLAEASQGLKNARTIVSLSPQDVSQGSELLGTLQRMLLGAIESYRADAKKPKAK